MKLSWQTALENRRNNRDSAKFPAKDDARAGPLVLPILKPRFLIPEGATIFTIGSCFARNIEEKLAGFALPTMLFTSPANEWPGRANGLLNEYNPGTMAQRITFALTQGDYPKQTIVDSEGSACDLSLPGGSNVPLERALERRKEIRAIYEHLSSCDVVIITLGLNEAWYDSEHAVYLNRMPPLDVLRRTGSRFQFHSLDFATSFGLLDKGIGQLTSQGKKILLTVSPVPLQTTFSGQDAVIANDYSKAVLRVCAKYLYDKYPAVDYFPSYEIIKMQGVSAFGRDNVHVRDPIVGQVTDYMIKSYIPRTGGASTGLENRLATETQS